MNQIKSNRLNNFDICKSFRLISNRISIAWVQNERLYETSFNSSELFLEFFQCNQTGDRLYWLHNCQIYSVLESLSIASNWISSKLIKIFKLTRQYDLVESSTSEWSNLFYDCHDHRWFISYHSLIIQSIQNDGYHQDSTISTISSIKSGENFSNNQTKSDSINEQQYSTRQSMRGDQPTASDWKVDDVGTSERDEISHWFRVKGVISVDIDVTETDINQCGERNFYKQTIKAEPNHSENFVSKSSPPSSINEIGTSRTTLQLFGTHKCHNENSEVIWKFCYSKIIDLDFKWFFFWKSNLTFFFLWTLVFFFWSFKSILSLFLDIESIQYRRIKLLLIPKDKGV